MTHETTTSLPAADVLARAREFFTDRVPHFSAFLEQEGPTWATYRGQGGEEIALAVIPADGATRVRASTLLFDQPVARFLATLPEAG